MTTLIPQFDLSNGGFIPTGAINRPINLKLQEIISVKDFGAVGNGTTNDTAAINAAITYVSGLTNGGAVFFPVGVYAVTEINATSITAQFNKTVKLYGAGRNMSKIIPFSAGNVLLNMMGSNQMVVQDLTFDSTVYASQCAIFMARSTTSTNCNNNKFINVYTLGSYTVSSIVCNGSESSNWFNSKFTNTNATANYSCFWTGGGSLIGGLQNITVINGGTISNSNNPNTDNKMFGCEFYSPFNSAYIIRFSEGAEYSFYGCTIIGGSANNCRLVMYEDILGGRFNGPIIWFGCHFEVFGTGNTVHWLYGNNSIATFDGISSYGGYYVLSNNTSVIDYDRTNINEQPQLSSSTFTTPTTTPNSTGTNFYIYNLLNSNISFKPNSSDGNVFVFGYAQYSNIDCVNFYGAGTRFLSCIYNTTATALPTTGSYTVGTTIQREAPVVGQPIGWKCTVSGTLGTLNGGATTGNITSGNNVLTVNSLTGLAEGQCITIAGSGAGPYYIKKINGTNIYLDANASATVTNAVVAFSNATLVALANL